MGDEEIGREIVRVLGQSPSPLKAHDIRTKLQSCSCSKQDVNRVLYSKQHLEVELANPGQTPPLWRLKASSPPHPAMGGMVSPVMPLQIGMASHPSSQPIQPGGMVSPFQTGGVASPMSPPPIGGMASPTPPPPIGDVASQAAQGQLYRRKDSEDGSLTFKPVGATSSVPQRVRAGHMTYDQSHTTETGRDVMPGHVTCSPMEESQGACGEEAPQCYDVGPNSTKGVINNLTSPPTTNLARDFPSDTFPVPVTPQAIAKPSDSKEGGTHPSNFVDATRKNFPSKETNTKNSKIANQLERAVNNSEVPAANTPSSTSRPKKTKLAVKFPQTGTNTSSVPLSSNTPPRNSSVAVSSNADIVSSMQSLDVQEQPTNSNARILQVLRERGRMSTAEMSRHLGMEGQVEELIYSLMKLAEEGRAVKRSEGGMNYWSSK